MTVVYFPVSRATYNLLNARKMEKEDAVLRNSANARKTQRNRQTARRHGRSTTDAQS